MRELALRKTEAGLEIFCEVLSAFDSGENSFVGLSLVSELVLRVCILCLGLTLGKELLLLRFSRCGLGLGEVSVVDFVVDLGR